mgnify:FL=1
MTVEKVKRMMDACYLAKRIRDMLPKLPKGVLPSYIHYLDVIIELEKKGIQVKVSDISDTLKIPRPGVTKTVKEMEEKGYLKKQSSKEDGRITYITITDKGQGLSDKYNDAYFGKLCEWLSGIPEADADCMIQTIETFYEVMQERREDFE